VKKINNLLFLTLLIYSGISSASTFISFNSEKGDYIGQGESRVWVEGNGEFSSRSNLERKNVVTINFTSDENWWTLNFAAPSDQALTVGKFANATRYPFQDTDKNGLSVSGTGRGCNTLEGQFEVLEISYDNDGKLKNFAATFEQHCEKGDPALFGTVSFNANVDVPDTGVVPVAGDFSVDLKANGQDNPVTVKIGDTIDLSWSAQAGESDVNAEYWLGLIGSSSEKKWFNNGQWRKAKGSLIWKTATVNTTQRDFSWTPQVPGIYMLQLILDTQVGEPVQIDNLSAHDHVVIIVE
jgi:hypothetical protein